MSNNINDISKYKQKLPTHTAPDSIWNSIEQVIDRKSASEATLKKAIDKLPGYSAPTAIWENIEKSIRKKSADSKSLWWVLKIAAILILILSISTIIKEGTNQDYHPPRTIVQNNPQSTEKEKPNFHNHAISKNDESIIKPENIKKSKILQKKSRGTINTSKSQQIKVSGYEAIDKTQLVSLNPISVTAVQSAKKGNVSLLTDNSKISKPMADNSLKITRVKLIVHNDINKEDHNVRQFSFALFKPLSFPIQQRDSSQRKTKQILAASINL